MYKPRRVDCLLGVDVYAAIIQTGVRTGPPRTPVGQATTLGCILTRQTDRETVSQKNTVVQSLLPVVEPTPPELFSMYWELEEVPRKVKLSCVNMRRIPIEERSVDGCYLPHHPVPKRDGDVRIVFNASQKYENDRSVNDHLLARPKLQQEIIAIIIRWRFFAVAFTIDIVKMFRQIRIHSEYARW